MIDTEELQIKDLVKDRTVSFYFLRHNVAYYKIKGLSLYFPVPLEDVGDATLLAEEKAILFMRYIRKAQKENTLVPMRGEDVTI